MLQMRCLLVWLAATAGVGAAAPLLTPSIALLTSQAGPVDVVVGMCAVAAAVSLVWGWAATTAVVVEAALDHRLPVPGIPAGLRRLVLASCGVVLAGSGVAPAVAAPSGDDPSGLGVHGLPLPDRPHAPAAPIHALTARTVAVQPGDSLWSLAAADLPPGAAPATVDERWRAIYRLNRPVVGPDPDHVRPGQLLRLPDRTPRQP